MSVLLEVEGLHAGYGPVNVLEDVSLTVGEGETVALLGANGAGKTTTLRAICGMVKPRGSVADRRPRRVQAARRSGSSGSASRTCPRGAGRSRR